MADYILEMDTISKSFPGVKALSDVNFKVERGEIHCLVGENGAGKSTLMKVLSGVYPHGEYEGEIIYNGKAQQFREISDSVKVGIGIIYQELALFPDLTVYENIFAGNELKSGPFINWNETITASKKLLEKVRLRITPETMIRDLNVGRQQLVEIAKALSKDVKLLILDEPTAALNEDDSENLLQLLKELKSQGISCIMISHKLKEVISIADKVTVLRDGKTIGTMDAQTEEITENKIIRSMVGRDIEDIYPKRPNQQIGETVLAVRDWSAYDSNLDRQVVKDAHVELKKGEIIGIAGLMGAGRTELALSIFGNPKHYKMQGELEVLGKKRKLKHTSEAIKAGIAYVTEDRKGDGLFLLQDIRENISAANLQKIASGETINVNEEVKVAQHYKQSLNIKASSLEQEVGKLSGGNQQKVSVAKWLFTEPKILILDEPTRGIDVGAKFEMYTIMNELVDKGMSIMMISSELPEVLGMSDRIYVMAEGRIKGELSRSEANEENIMALATQ